MPVLVLSLTAIVETGTGTGVSFLFLSSFLAMSLEALVEGVREHGLLFKGEGETESYE